MRIVLALVAAALYGCATSAKFEAKMNGLVGQPESAVVSMYGPPHGAYNMSDGSKVIQYTRGGQVVLPGVTTTQPVVTNTTGSVTLNQGYGYRPTTGTYNQQSTTYVTRQAPPSVVQTSCTVNFTVDRSGIVRSWTANGNRCVAE